MKKLTSEQASEQLTHALVDTLFPMVDTIEELYMAITENPEELSGDVEAFLMFAYRLMHQGWEFDELQELLNDALGDVVIEKEKVVVQ